MYNWERHSESIKEYFAGLEMRVKELEEHEDIIKIMPLIESATRKFNSYVEQSEECEIFKYHVTNQIEEYQELKELYQKSELFQKYIYFMDRTSSNPICNILFSEAEGVPFTKMRIVQSLYLVNIKKQKNEEAKNAKTQNEIEDLGHALDGLNLPLE